MIAMANLPISNPAPVSGKFSTSPNVGTRGCRKLFTVRMGTRAIGAVYAGSRNVSDRERAMLRRIVQCQRNRAARPFLRHVWARHIRTWRIARQPANGPVTASWFDDSGATACGIHATYGFASLFLACGTQITMTGPGGSVVATMEDHGPYVAGRTFDLNPALKAALGCGDLCSVTWK